MNKINPTRQIKSAPLVAPVLNTFPRRRVKSVCIRRFSGPYFPAFGLNTKRYRVSLRIQSECEKIRTRKTPDTDTFHAVHFRIKLIS